MKNTYLTRVVTCMRSAKVMVLYKIKSKNRTFTLNSFPRLESLKHLWMNFHSNSF